MEQHEDIGTIRDLAPMHIQIAYENLNDAISLLSNGRIRSASSRAYYAVFRAICAVHALTDDQYKSHKTALAEFNKRYISNETFPRIYGKKMYKLMQLRDISDYEDRLPDKFDNQVFEKQCSHDDAAIIAGKALYRDGYDTVSVLIILDAVAPKAADKEEYACRILKQIQKDPLIAKIINKQKKKLEQSKDEGLSL